VNGEPWPREVRDFRVAVTSKERAVFGPAARELRRWMLANDPHRPCYHFTAPEGWINDPNGPIYHDGTYHLFYQYRPVFANGSESEICWGHASSADLLHWEDWPVAMWPDRRYDVAGVYSGNTFIDDDGFPCALYTGNVAGHAQASGVLARSTDGWLTWHKHKVMDNEQRPNAASPVHWDAQVWKEGELWQQLIGGAVGEGAGQRGAAHLWTSPELEEWTYRGTIAEDHDPERRYWELPYLVPFGAAGGAPDGERAVLMVGARNNPYWTGSYDRVARRFHPDRREPRFVDLGLYYCVNPHLVDDRGPDGSPRRLLHGWVLGARSPVDTVPYWIGAHSIPRVLELADDELLQSPVPEIETLRGPVQRQQDLVIAPGTSGYLEHVAGDALELELTVDLRRTGARRFGAGVRLSRDGRGARVWYEPAGNRIGVDRLLGPEQVYADPAANQRGDLQGAAEKLQAPQVIASAGTAHGESGTVTLRIFVDRSILEVYCGGAALTDRLYPDASATGVDLYAENGVAHFRTVSVWPLRGTW
jgi:beta-fructofuranosidase